MCVTAFFARIRCRYAISVFVLYTEYKYRQREHRAFGPGGLAVRSFDVCVKLREVRVKLA